MKCVWIITAFIVAMCGTALAQQDRGIANPVSVIIPKGNFDIGVSFDVINGSANAVTVRGSTDDNQMFGSAQTYNIPAGEERTFTQTGFPRGNIWSTQ